MLNIDPKDTATREIHAHLLGGVGPRPIALVSTLSADGVPNLSPFSFFNAFGANPPTVAFSPARRLRNNTVKDTYNNLKATGECVIQAVTHSIVHQVNLASAEFPSDVDEFTKCGLTKQKSDVVKPFRVGESPFQMECKLTQMIELGGQGASGNLAICEVLRFHIAEDILVNGRIHPDRIDLVSRMGGDFYCRASGEALFTLPKPPSDEVIGFDRLPKQIRESQILTGNNLGQLAGFSHIPSMDDAMELVNSFDACHIKSLDEFHRHQQLGEFHAMLETALCIENEDHPSVTHFFEETAKSALDFGNDVSWAWKVLVYAHRK